MTTSLWKAWRKPKARRAARMQASGSSPFTWKIGAWTILATSVGYTDERGRLGGGREPQLVVHHDMDRAAGAVPGQLGQLEGLGHHALAGEGGVAVDEHRQHVETAVASPPCPAWPAPCPRRRGRPPRGATGSTPGSRVELGPGPGHELARGPLVVLHVSRALHRVRDRDRPRTPGRSPRRTCPRCWRGRSAGPGAPCRAPLR